mmetsp:Transcript_20386/g.40374  ORF Transcript_20386/g.40374 Transcript_20386/m.40374 type:complete len:85 (-) Transcript_20386:1103-1357(-)
MKFQRIRKSEKLIYRPLPTNSESSQNILSQQGVLNFNCHFPTSSVTCPGKKQPNEESSSKPPWHLSQSPSPHPSLPGQTSSPKI